MKNPREAIFFGEDYFKITVYLSNGYIITRIVEKKKSGKNGYEIFDPTTGISSYYNTKGLELVQEILGFNKIKLTDRNKINVNFSVQGEGWFMLGNNMSAPDRAKLIGVMYGTHYADAVLKDLNAQSKKIVSEINMYQKDIDKLQQQADGYLYLEPLNDCLDQAELLYKEATELEEVINTATKLLQDRSNIEKEINELNSLIEEISKNEIEYKNLLEEIKADIEQISKIEQCMLDINTIIKDGKQARFVVNNLVTLDDAKSLYKEIDNLDKEIVKDSEVLQKGKKLELELNNITKELTSLDTLNNSLINISKANEVLSEIKALNEEVIDISDKVQKSKAIIKEQENLTLQINMNTSILKELENLSNVNELLSEIKVIEEEVKQTSKIVNEVKEIERDIELAKKEEEKHREQTLIYLEQYKKELETMGQCPVCHGNIDNAVINSLVSDLSKNLG